MIIGAIRPRLRAVTLLSVVLIAASNSATAQTERDQSTRAVAVVFVSDAESGRPLSGAIVRDSLSGNEATTGADGTARLKSVGAAGPFYIFTISKIGYRPTSLRLHATDVREANAVVLAELVHVAERVAVLDPVVTTATSSTLSKNIQGFETAAATWDSEGSLSRRKSFGQNGELATSTTFSWPMACSRYRRQATLANLGARSRTS